MQAQKEKQAASGGGASRGGPKKADVSIPVWLVVVMMIMTTSPFVKLSLSLQMGNVQDARREMTKTKEQLEEEKKISLSIRIKPLDLEGMDSDQLRNKANDLWDTIVRLETEKYDLEERQKRQDYDVSRALIGSPKFDPSFFLLQHCTSLPIPLGIP